MRMYLSLIGSAALVLLALGAMDVVHSGWDAVAGGAALVGAITALLAFAVFLSEAARAR
jgi:hypothetical protein